MSEDEIPVKTDLRRCPRCWRAVPPPDERGECPRCGLRAGEAKWQRAGARRPILAEERGDDRCERCDSGLEIRMPERRMKSPWVVPAVFAPFLIVVPLLIGAPVAIGSVFLALLLAMPAYFTFRRNGGRAILRNPVVVCHGCGRLRVHGVEDGPTGADRRSAILSLERLCWTHLAGLFFTFLYLFSGGASTPGALITTTAVLAALFLSMLFMSQCLIAFLPTPGSWWTRILVPKRPVEP